MSEQTTGRRLLAMVRPPKPISEMNEQELEAFVVGLSDLIAQRLGEDTKRT